MQEAARREAALQPADQRVGQRTLVGADRRGGPFRAVHVVDGDEGRLAAHGQAHVAVLEQSVDPVAQCIDRAPLRIRVGLGHTRRLDHALDRHLEFEGHFAVFERAADRRGMSRIGSTGEGDMTLACEQTRGRIEPHPSGAGQVDLAPGVQVGEILLGAGGTVERFLVRLQLDEITRGEPRRDAEVPEQLHQQPRRVAAGAGTRLQRLVRRLDAGLHADQVADVALQLRIQVEQKARRRFFDARDGGEVGLEPRPDRRLLEERLEIFEHLRRIGEGKHLRFRLQEEIERIDDVHFRHQVDGDGEMLRLLRDHDPRQPVGLRILLPVEEMLLWLDLQAVGQDRRAAMRRRTQAHQLGSQRDRLVIAVAGGVGEGDLDAHIRTLPHLRNGRHPSVTGASTGAGTAAVTWRS